MANFLTRRLKWLSPHGEELRDVEDVVSYLQGKVACERLALYVATSYIANALSGCEVQVYEKGELARDSQMWWLLNVSPNPNQNASQFMNDLVTRLCMEGEALVVPLGEHLYVAESFSEEKVAGKENIFHGVVIEEKSYARPWGAGEVYHFRLENRNVRVIVDQLYEDYAKLIEAAQVAFVQTHGRKYKLILDHTKAGDAEFNETYEKVIKGHLEEFMNSASAVYPQFAGQELVEMKHEAAGDSSDIIAMRKEVFDLAGQAFKIPTSMMYGNTNNTKDVGRQFLTYAVDPPARMIGDEYTRKTYTFTQWRHGSRIAVNTKRINHVDILDVASDVDKLISSGMFSIDGLLAELDYPTLGTEFSSAHYITKNYELAEEAMTRLAEGGDTNE